MRGLAGDAGEVYMRNAPPGEKGAEGEFGDQGIPGEWGQFGEPGEPGIYGDNGMPGFKVIINFLFLILLSFFM